MIRAMVVLIVCALAGGVWAQADEQVPAVVVTLKFTGRSVELAKKETREAHVVPQYGMPQLEELFYEAYGADGEAVYAGAIDDPLEVHGARLPGAPPDALKVKEGRVRIAIPRAAGPRQLKVFRSVEGDDGKRELLLEVSL